MKEAMESHGNIESIIFQSHFSKLDQKSIAYFLIAILT